MNSLLNSVVQDLLLQTKWHRFTPNSNSNLDIQLTAWSSLEIGPSGQNLYLDKIIEAEASQ